MHHATRLTALGLAAATGLAAAGPAAAAAPRAQLRSFVCQPAVQPASRAISVTSVIRPVTGTRAMEVRFELLARPSGASGYARVSGSDLGRWLSPATRTLGSRPGDVWILNKPVVGLAAPASYRFRVGFRWIGARHRVIAGAVRTAGPCWQPELRPDLVIRRIGAPQPNRKGTLDLYAVTIANRGATTAPAFTVGLASGHSGQPSTAAVAGLAAHQSVTVTLRGPLCSGAEPPVITADLYDQVADFNRSNNVAAASCTSATTPF